MIVEQEMRRCEHHVLLNCNTTTIACVGHQLTVETKRIMYTIIDVIGENRLREHYSVWRGLRENVICRHCSGLSAENPKRLA